MLTVDLNERAGAVAVTAHTEPRLCVAFRILLSLAVV
jgi:hypothetical protein